MATNPNQNQMISQNQMNQQQMNQNQTNQNPTNVMAPLVPITGRDRDMMILGINK